MELRSGIETLLEEEILAPHARREAEKFDGDEEKEVELDDEDDDELDDAEFDEDDEEFLDDDEDA